MSREVFEAARPIENTKTPASAKPVVPRGSQGGE